MSDRKPVRVVKTFAELQVLLPKDGNGKDDGTKTRPEQQDDEAAATGG